MFSFFFFCFSFQQSVVLYSSFFTFIIFISLFAFFLYFNFIAMLILSKFMEWNFNYWNYDDFWLFWNLKQKKKEKRFYGYCHWLSYFVRKNEWKWRKRSNVIQIFSIKLYNHFPCLYCHYKIAFYHNFSFRFFFSDIKLKRMCYLLNAFNMFYITKKIHFHNSV